MGGILRRGTQNFSYIYWHTFQRRGTQLKLCSSHKYRRDFAYRYVKLFLYIWESRSNQHQFVNYHFQEPNWPHVSQILPASNALLHSHMIEHVTCKMNIPFVHNFYGLVVSKKQKIIQISLQTSSNGCSCMVTQSDRLSLRWQSN